MPNWVHNELTVQGDQAEVNKALDAIKGENAPIDFNRIIPYPRVFADKDYIAEQTLKEIFSIPPDDPDRHEKTEALLKHNNLTIVNMSEPARADNGGDMCIGPTLKDGFNDGGREWREKNWGTKWNAWEVEKIDDVVSFVTAWSPPLPLIEKLSASYPELVFELNINSVENGNYGKVIYRAGKITHNECHDYDFDKIESQGKPWLYVYWKMRRAFFWLKWHIFINPQKKHTEKEN